MNMKLAAVLLLAIVFSCQTIKALEDTDDEDGLVPIEDVDYTGMSKL